MSEPTVKCPDCVPLDGIDPATCERCGGTQVVPACAECLAMPRDPMWSPACGSVCSDAWQAKQRLAGPSQPLIRKAP